MHRDAKLGGNVPALDGADLVRLCPGLEDVGGFTIEDWARMPACHFDAGRLWALRERVQAIIDGEAIAGGAPPDGVVITHGTDVLEETAYVLARTLATRIPVVLTGAMRTTDDGAWDGPRNLLDAAIVAADASSRGRGVMVVFAGEVFVGHQVQKVETQREDAFAAPFHGAMGRVGLDGPRWSRPLPPMPALLVPRGGLWPRVALVPMVVGDDGHLLDLARPSHQGVVIQGFGAGNVPPGAVPAIRRWLDEGKPVVLGTRCPRGTVGPLYAFEGGGRRLMELGVLPAGYRTAAQARMELLLCLASGSPYLP